jgi:alpha/beta superfamily hydrolase
MTSPTLPPMEPFAIEGPAGRIDGRLELPSPAERARPLFLAVFGHPHPQHGGTMQNSVVVHGARALAALGGAVARFDFRGVGRSEGSWDEGRGEQDDFLSVIAYVRARWPEVARLVAAGFSFGSIRALECAARGAADAWLGVAPPLTLAKYVGHVPDHLAAPAALVLAGNDELVVPATAAELARRFAELRAVEVVAGAGHLFTGRIKEVAAAIGRVARTLLAP